MIAFWLTVAALNAALAVFILHTLWTTRRRFR